MIKIDSDEVELKAKLDNRGNSNEIDRSILKRRGLICNKPGIVIKSVQNWAHEWKSGLKIKCRCLYGYSKNDKMQWILDIGANSHMSLDEDDLDGLRLLDDPINISITNECSAEATSTGSVPTIITNGEFVIIRFFYLFQIQIDDLCHSLLVYLL